MRADLRRNRLRGDAVRRHHRRDDRHEVSACRLRAPAEHGHRRCRHADDGAARPHLGFRNRRGQPRARGVCLRHGHRLHGQSGDPRAAGHLQVPAGVLRRRRDEDGQPRRAREDGQRRDDGRHGVRQRVPRRHALDGAQARRVPPHPARHRQRADDGGGAALQRRPRAAQDGHLLAVRVPARARALPRDRRRARHRRQVEGREVQQLHRRHPRTAEERRHQAHDPRLRA